MTQDELKALIEDLRLNHEYCPKEVILQAADELERLVQPEQEPVALEQERKAFEEWIDSGFINKGHAAFHKFSDRDAYCIDEIQNKWKAWKERAKRTSPPPPRTWVGLTDEEMEATFIECGGKWNGDYWRIEDADFHPFLRTIEARLKEINHGK